MEDQRNWANCPTHGPIQDARRVFNGEDTVNPAALYCRCGLECTEYSPTAWIEVQDLAKMAAENKQPYQAPVPEEKAPEPRKAPAKKKDRAAKVVKEAHANDEADEAKEDE